MDICSVDKFKSKIGNEKISQWALHCIKKDETVISIQLLLYTTMYINRNFHNEKLSQYL